MSDDLNKKIKQITDLLGQETIPDNLKGLLSMLATSGPKEEASPKQVEMPALKDDKPVRSELDDNVEMVRRIKKVMDRVNTNNDPRINLLTAIRPFLSSRRQKKLNNCIKMIGISSMARLMDENDLGL